MSVDAERRVVELEREQRETARTISFLAELLGKTLGERDRARDLAARLESELAKGKEMPRYQSWQSDPLD